VEPRFLLDTDICIYIRRGQPEPVLKRFRTVRPGEATLSVITYGELLCGAEKNALRARSLERLRQLTVLIPTLPLPESAAEVYGFVRAELERKGEMIGNNDLWIAAHALASGLTLVTNNEKEFRRVKGLKVQNWTV
jgi:tRNA(fMet)-specific endonuclease VapC